MSKTERLMGKRVIMRTCNRDIYGKGIVISWCDSPTYLIQMGDGRIQNWRCDMTELDTQLMKAYTVFTRDGVYAISALNDDDARKISRSSETGSAQIIAIIPGHQKDIGR